MVLFAWIPERKHSQSKDWLKTGYFCPHIQLSVLPSMQGAADDTRIPQASPALSSSSFSLALPSLKKSTLVCKRQDTKSRASELGTPQVSGLFRNYETSDKRCRIQGFGTCAMLKIFLQTVCLFSWNVSKKIISINTFPHLWCNVRGHGRNHNTERSQSIFKFWAVEN